MNEKNYKKAYVKRFVFLLVIFIFMFSSHILAAWNKTDLGSGGFYMLDVAVGNGRNDGLVRVYCGSADYHMYEFSYSGSSWTKVDLGSKDNWIRAVSIGNGRNDGVMYVYCASNEYLSNDGSIYEFAYSGGSWSNVNIGTVDGFTSDVAIGDGRNDGINRVYGANSPIYEFTYSGGSWVKVEISTDIGNMTGVSIGSGRNDGVKRVYFACDNDRRIYEYTYSGGAWTKVDLGLCAWNMYDVAIGDGRNDGVNRVYGACGNGHVYEFSYSGGVWTKVDLGGTLNVIYKVSIGNGRNDGIMRVYGASGDRKVCEFTYSSAGSSWTKVDLGSVSDQVRSVAIGNGRNDGAMRIYSASNDNHIYEDAYLDADPQLSFTNESSSYTGTCVNPSFGDNNTTFYFHVKYTDNYPPLSGSPQLNVLRGGTTLYTYSGMSLDSGDYLTGAIYSTSTLLTPCSWYSYTITAFDNQNVFSSLPLRDSGPDVGYKISGQVLYPDGVTQFPSATVKIVEVATRTHVSSLDGSYELSATCGHNWTLSVSSIPSVGSISFMSIPPFLVASNISQDVLRLNSAPVLNWEGASGVFMSDGVDPEQGTSSTTYTFKVKYIDSENDGPLNNYPRVVILKNYSVYKTIVMNYESGSNYASGIIFSTCTQLSPGIYSYYFEAKDRWNATGAGVATNEKIDAINVKARINAKVVLPDGSPMQGVKLDLAGAVNTTKYSSITGSATFYYLTTGVNYILSPSSYAYYSFFISTGFPNGSFGNDVVRANYSPLPDDVTVQFTRTNFSSTTFTGEPGYEMDGVSPDVGSVALFTYKCKYVDSDNDIPAAGYPKLRILKGGTTVQDVSLISEDGSTNYISGKIYKYQTTLPQGLDYSYYFVSRDTFSLESRTPILNGPSVNTRPVLSFEGSTGFVSDCVSPDTSTYNGVYMFKVKYTDADNNQPKSGYPRLIIRRGNQTAYQMTMNQNSGAYDTGAIYSTSTLLSPCSYYSYTIEAYDINEDSATSFLTGNGPDVGYKIMGHVYWTDGATPFSAATVTAAVGSVQRTVVSDTNGYYELNLTANNNWTITVSSNPALSGSCLFTPASPVFNNVSNDMEQNFQRQGGVPILVWTGETGYIADGLEPPEGASTTTFTFRVKYTDAENDAPAAGYPRVRIKKNSATIKLLAMNYSPGDYTAGIIASTSTELPPGIYTYTFEANDVTGAGTTKFENGPDVKAKVSGRVVYPDNSGISNVRVNLSYGSPVTNSVKYTDTNGEFLYSMLETGIDYTVSVSTDFTPYTFHFTSLSDNTTMQFTRITKSSITWAGETGYISDAVEPNIGLQGGYYVYKIKYANSDGDIPLSGYPKVVIKKDGIAILGSPFAMSSVSGAGIVSGLLYSCTVQLMDASTNYTYSFTAYDAHGPSCQTPEYVGPTLNLPPQLSWVGTTGYETGAIDTTVISHGTTTYYFIKYTDVEGNAPAAGYPKLHVYSNSREISGSPFAMVYVSGNNSGGAVYGFSKLFAAGNYTYRIDVYDSLGSAGATINGNGPFVGNKVSGFVKNPAGIGMPGIELTCSGGSVQSSEFTTQSNGYFEFLISTEGYKISVSSPSYYLFNPSSYTFACIQANTTGYVFTRISRQPVVECNVAGKIGVSAGIKKSVALPGEAVRFDVVYTDPDKDMIKAGFPVVYILKGELSACTTVQMLGMNYVTGDMETGITYSTAAVLSSMGAYSYIVNISDIFDNIVSSGINNAFYVCYNEQPSIPENISNVKGDKPVTNAKVYLKWKACNSRNGGVFYTLYLSGPYDDTAVFAPVISGLNRATVASGMNAVYTGTEPGYELTSLAGGKTYQWQVAAKDAFGFESVSGVNSFSTVVSNVCGGKAFNYPNPFNPGVGETTNFVFNMTESGSAELKVYSELGDLCWSMSASGLPQGLNEITYNGRDGNGQMMYNGTYVCIIMKKYAGRTEKDWCRILIIK